MGASSAFTIGKARLTFRVVNEDGQPVPTASVRGYFENPRAADYAGDIFDKRTDRNGEAVAKGAVFGFVEGWVLCDRHYKTSYRFANPHAPKSAGQPNAWPEWVATNTVVLKRIRNPVPMYVKKIDGPFPARDVFVGYDMVTGDWMPPYGRGRETDMEVRYSQIVISTNRLGDPMESDGTLVLRFSRDGDGILQSFLDTTSGSAYQTLYAAPADGYVKEVTYRRRRTIGRPLETNSDPNHSHYFRVRTVRDGNGNIIKAMYGKFMGSMSAQRLYYLNPDGTRNVEFDPERNCFGDDKREVGSFAP
jgi:hypothetical protein